MERYITVKEAAKRLGLCPDSVKRWIHEGRLSAVRTSDSPSGHWRILESSINQSNRHKAG